MSVQGHAQRDDPVDLDSAVRLVDAPATTTVLRDSTGRVLGEQSNNNVAASEAESEAESEQTATQRGGYQPQPCKENKCGYEPEPCQQKKRSNGTKSRCDSGDQVQFVDQDASNTSTVTANAIATQTAPVNTGGPQTTVTGDNDNRQFNTNLALSKAKSEASSKQSAVQF